MSDTRGKYVAPSVSLTAFSCPHCGTLTSQQWFSTYGRRLDTPFVIRAEEIEDRVRIFRTGDFNKEQVENYTKTMEGYALGRPLLDKEETKYLELNIVNLNLSQCYECHQMAVWLHGTLLWPANTDAPIPSVDMPDDVKVDYCEAAAVHNRSTRSAAALLRLAIQKLTKHLGGEGKNINDDIATLVKRGLDPRVQKALDVVRVTGNNAVHPGQMSSADMDKTTQQLFSLANLICEIMITQPKHIADLYKTLPPSVLEQIEKRDGK